MAFPKARINYAVMGTQILDKPKVVAITVSSHGKSTIIFNMRIKTIHGLMMLTIMLLFYRERPKHLRVPSIGSTKILSLTSGTGAQWKR